MTTTAAGSTSPPAKLEALVERFDPTVIDVLPKGRGRVRLVVMETGAWDAVIGRNRVKLEPAREGVEPDALLSADSATWTRISRDLRGGMEAFGKGRLHVRRNLHLGVGFLAATSMVTDPGRLRFHSVRTSTGRISVMEAGQGRPMVCLPGLGGTKASFLPTVAAMASESRRVIAIDLPGFGDSVKPIGAPYNARWFARTVIRLFDAMELDVPHLVGNSMGGRVAIEVGLTAPDRTGCMVLLAPALAWLRDRPWAPFLRFVRPELGLLQITPRPVVEGVIRRLIPGAVNGWAAAGVDEFLRAYLTPRGRAAFYAAARNIYLDEPYGEDGLWTRMADLSPDTMFVWGRKDNVVPIAFMKHVEEALPAARHVELDCGHVPQVELPRETHAAIEKFLRES
jgi:pimeloyl-ACP methyl ester carboxylesterase